MCRAFLISGRNLWKNLTELFLFVNSEQYWFLESRNSYRSPYKPIGIHQDNRIWPTKLSSVS